MRPFPLGRLEYFQFLRLRSFSCRNSIALLILALTPSVWSPVTAQNTEPLPKSVASQHQVFELFIQNLEVKQRALATKQKIEKQPTMFQGQLADLNAALQAPAVDKPYELLAKLDRFNDGSFSSLGELMPSLVPNSKARPSPDMEFRSIKKLDIAQAMQLTLNQNLQIGIANQTMNIAKWNYAGALGGFAPSINLSLQENGLRRYTSTIPRLPVNTNSSQLFANFSYSLFQGGKVLFSAINTHELLLQQKGLFAAVRNDNLNQVVSTYYNLLSAQAILNVRMDSALFCAQQLREFKELYVRQTFQASSILTAAAQCGTDLSDSAQRVNKCEARLTERLNKVRQTLPSSGGIAKSSSLTNRLAEIHSQLSRSSGSRQSYLFNSQLLENVLRATMANEEYKRDIVRSANLNDGLPESTTSALALDSLVAVKSTHTRYSYLSSSMKKWLESLTIARQASVAALRADNAAAIAVAGDAGANRKVATAKISGAIANSELAQKQTELQLFTESNGIERELEGIVAELEQPINSTSRKEIGARIRSINIERLARIQQLARKLASAHLNSAKALGRAAEYEQLSTNSQAAILTAMDFENAVCKDWQILSDNFDRFSTAYLAQFQKAKQTTDLLNNLLSQLEQMQTEAAGATLVDAQIASQIEELCGELEFSYRAISPTNLASLKSEVAGLRLVSRGLTSEAQLGKNLFIQASQYLIRARDIVAAEAGYAFQVDQWNTQLASDTQDIINQYLTLRTFSIAIATQLNIDPRICMLSTENYIACRARDLSNLGFVELTRQTLNNRPELFAADEFRRAALSNVEVAASALMPTVLATGQLGTSGSSNRFDTIHLVRSKSFGLEVNYRFTNLLLPAMSSVAAQGATAIRAYLQFRDQLNVVMREVHNSFINVQTAKLRVATAMQKAQKATKQLVEADTPENRSKASASNLDIITALRDRNSAMVDVANTMANYNAVQAQLLRDSGQIYPISNYLAQ